LTMQRSQLATKFCSNLSIAHKKTRNRK